MYKLNNHFLLSVLLLLSLQSNNLNAFPFADSFKEMFDEMDHAFKNMQHELKAKFNSKEKLSTEDQQLVNKQLEIVSKIKPEITKNENGLVSIVFPIENIDKEKIELSSEHGLLYGFMPLEHGYFRFVIDPKFIKYEYLIEITKEVTEDTGKESKDQAKETYSHAMSWRTSNSFIESLPLEVDLSKEPQSETKNNKLFIRIDPKNYKRLKIRHVKP